MTAPNGKVPWRDYDPYIEFGGETIPEHLQDMRYVHKFAPKKTAHEPKIVTGRLEPFRDVREKDSGAFLRQMLALEKEVADKTAAVLALEAGGAPDAPNADTAHCVALVEQLIAEYHEKHPMEPVS